MTCSEARQWSAKSCSKFLHREQREGIVRARVTTAVAIDDPRRADVVRRLERSSGKKVRATFAVDPSLIGGTRVQLGDRLVDTSLATQLQELKRSLAGAP